MYRFFFKRFIDIIASFSVLFFLSPILIVVTIWLHFANKGAGIFFTPLRPGKNGKMFKLFKFKSMRDAYDANGYRLPDEKRLTTVGRIIRLASIDELPQLFNVLKGDMSFVGPRPLSATYLPYYNEEESRRHNVLPGITGLAQANGRTSIMWSQKMDYDIYYVDHVSFGLDMRIILKTIVNVLSHKDVGVDASGKMPFSAYRESQWAAEGRQDLINDARKKAEYYWSQIDNVRFNNKERNNISSK